MKSSHVVVSVLGVAGALGFGWLLLRAPGVPVVPVARGSITQTIVASGQVMSPAEIKVGAMVSSTAEDVFVREGELVTTGQLLVRLDAGEARASLQQAEARLAAARAGRVELAKLSRPVAEASLRQAEADWLRASQRLRREQQLVSDGISTKSQLEEAEATLAIATAARGAARLKLEASTKDGSQTLAVQAAAAEAEALLALARERLARHEILAPTDGIVLRRNVEPGDAIATGSLLFVLSQTGATRLRIEPDERNLALLSVGQRAIASTEAYPADRFGAEVSYIAPAVDPERGTVEVQLRVPEPPKYLRPHMTISVEIEVQSKPSALTVPRSAVLDQASRPAVLIVEGGRTRRVEVELGLRGDDLVEVLSGINEGALAVRTPSVVEVPGERVTANRAE